MKNKAEVGVGGGRGDFSQSTPLWHFQRKTREIVHSTDLTPNTTTLLRLMGKPPF